jgi:hypothetical protein
MSIVEFHVPGEYDSPLTARGRARTIASFHLAQGDADIRFVSSRHHDLKWQAHQMRLRSLFRPLFSDGTIRSSSPGKADHGFAPLSQGS